MLIRSFIYSDSSRKRDVVIIEPWREFEIMNPGISRPKSRISFVPLKMMKSELIYEKEIPPNISFHAIRSLKERIDNKDFVKWVLGTISSYDFNIGSI